MSDQASEPAMTGLHAKSFSIAHATGEHRRVVFLDAAEAEVQRCRADQTARIVAFLRGKANSLAMWREAEEAGTLDAVADTIAREFGGEQ